MAQQLIHDYGTVSLQKNSQGNLAQQTLPSGFQDFTILVTQSGGAWAHGGAVAATITILVSYDGGVTYLPSDTFTDTVVDETSPAVIKNGTTIWPANSARLGISIDQNQPTNNMRVKASYSIGGTTRQAGVQFWGNDGQ